MEISYPGESADYRSARDALTRAEIDLRAQIANVAAQRQALPPGGFLPEDYEFQALDGSAVKLSALFGDKPTLAIYSLMYGPKAAAACPMCTSLLDGLNGQARHITQRASLVVVSSSGPERLRELARGRGWDDLRILSAAANTYQRDYFGQGADGSEYGMLNIFSKAPDGIRHFWGSADWFFTPVDGHPRHVDALWPLWNMLDLTPEGRGENWYPALSY